MLSLAACAGAYILIFQMAGMCTLWRPISCCSAGVQSAFFQLRLEGLKLAACACRLCASQAKVSPGVDAPCCEASGVAGPEVCHACCAELRVCCAGCPSGGALPALRCAARAALLLLLLLLLACARARAPDHTPSTPRTCQFSSIVGLVSLTLGLSRRSWLYYIVSGCCTPAAAAMRPVLALSRGCPQNPLTWTLYGLISSQVPHLRSLRWAPGSVARLPAPRLSDCTHCS